MSAADFTASDANDGQANIFHVDGNYSNGRIEIADGTVDVGDDAKHVLNVSIRGSSLKDSRSVMRVECRQVASTTETTSLEFLALETPMRNETDTSSDDLAMTDEDYDAVASALVILSEVASSKMATSPVSRRYATDCPGLAAAISRRGDLHTIVEPKADPIGQHITGIATEIDKATEAVRGLARNEALTSVVSRFASTLGPENGPMAALLFGVAREQVISGVETATQAVTSELKKVAGTPQLWVFSDRTEDELRAQGSAWSREHGRQAGEQLPEFLNKTRQLFDQFLGD